MHRIYLVAHIYPFFNFWKVFVVVFVVVEELPVVM